jgi:hypothetical protein
MFNFYCGLSIPFLRKSESEKIGTFSEGVILPFFQMAGFEQIEPLLYVERKRSLSTQSSNDHYQRIAQTITINQSIYLPLSRQIPQNGRQPATLVDYSPRKT